MAVRIELWNVPLMLISDLIRISIRMVSCCARALRFGSLHALTADQFVFLLMCSVNLHLFQVHFIGSISL